jgi:protein O-GlcNAc transferase
MAQAEQGRVGPAIAALERLASRRGAPPEVFHFLGLLLAQDGRAEPAVFHLERAVRAAPERPQFLGNLGNVLAGLGRLEEAADRYRGALVADEGYVHARVGLAGALLGLGRLAEAEGEARRAWGLAPDNAEAAGNLAGCLISTGRAPEAVDLLREAMGRIGPTVALQTLLAAAMNYDPRTSPEDALEAHRTLGRLHGLAARSVRSDPNLPPLHRPEPGASVVRIGYLSADLREHPVAMFIEPALAGDPGHRPAVEVYCYDVTGRRDGESQRLSGLPGVSWRDARGASDAALVGMIRRDRIDVLVELSGHSLGHRQTALAARAAPVQATMLGYPATTGNPAIDARLVDSHTDPEGSEDWCTERLVRLDPCAWCFSPPRQAPALSAAPFGDTGRIAFGSFNNLAKTTPDVLDTWAELLGQVHGSMLVLKCAAFVDALTRERIGTEMLRRGVAPERLALRPPTVDAKGHLEAYAGVDIALDTFPYAGTTTTCEALWMGVPVVTLAGRMHAGRVGVSLLRAVGLGDLVAPDRAAYVHAAAGLARDTERLAGLRATLRDRMLASPLMDASGFRARLHGALTGLVREGGAER